MNTHKGCVEVAPKEFRLMLKKIKKDGLIIHTKDGLQARFTKTRDRFNHDAIAVFSTPLVGYIKGDKTYMSPIKLHYYSNPIGVEK
jgi:hypothetical protein